MSFSIRVARASDAPVLVQIEQDAGQLFRVAEGLEWLSDQKGASAESYVKLIRAGTTWVVEDAKTLGGFLAARIEPPDLHIVEVCVRLEYQRRGLARNLIEKASDEARRLGLADLTLTTFKNIPWNEQLYARLGFDRLEEGATGKRLQDHLDLDAAAGLPRERRCAMRLRL